MSRASRVRRRYQRARAWWRRRQFDRVLGMAGPGGLSAKQAGELRDGQWDHPGSAGGHWLGRRRWWGLSIGAVAQRGGSDSTDRQRGHDQHSVAGDRVIEADL